MKFLYPTKFIHDDKKRISSIGIAEPLNGDEYPANSFINVRHIQSNEVIQICVWNEDYYVKGHEKLVLFFENEASSNHWAQEFTQFYRKVELDNY